MLTQGSTSRARVDLPTCRHHHSPSKELEA